MPGYALPKNVFSRCAARLTRGFYLTRKDEPVCTRSGALLYFASEREALEFLAEIGDIVLN